MAAALANGGGGASSVKNARQEGVGSTENEAKNSPASSAPFAQPETGKTPQGRRADSELPAIDCEP